MFKTLGVAAILVVAIGALVVPSARAQESDQGVNIGEALSGHLAPLSLTLKDLTPEWRRFTASEQSSGTQIFELLALAVNPYDNVYFTRGVTLNIGDEHYLIAYRVERKKIDMTPLMQGNGRNIPPPEKLTPDTALTLSLLNLRTLGSMNDVQPFDLAKELTDNEKAIAAAAANQPPGQPQAVQAEAGPQGMEAQSANNLKQLALGLLEYVQDYDEKLPPMESAAAFKKAVFPYARADPLFVNPINGHPYVPNKALSKKALAVINAPAEEVAIYEDQPAPDGTRRVAYVDGHVKALSAQEWARAKKASGIL